jgi:cytochrome c
MSKFLKLFAPAAGGAGAALAMAYVMADQFVVDMPAPARVATWVAPAQAEEPAPVAAPAAAAPAAVQVAASAAVPARVVTEGKMGLGRPALPEEVAAWNKDIMPDGSNLPVGSGDVWTGDEVFAEHCAACHGDFAEGIDNWPKLAGGWGSLADEDPLKTVGSYWPYLSTSFDYVRRSMPFGNAQSLTDDEVYAITAYILYSNNMVEDDFVLSNETFMDVEMLNGSGFVLDDRETSEAHFWTDAPCMENCKDTVEITMRATVLDVTPEEEGTDEAAAVPVAEEAPMQVAAAEPAAAPAAEAEVQTAMFDPALLAAGEKAFGKCKSCHQVGDGAKNRTGPVLNGIMGQPMGAVEGFKYSKVMSEAGVEGRVWDDASMTEFLTKPRDYMKGTKMSFNGFKDIADTEAVIAYLHSLSQ